MISDSCSIDFLFNWTSISKMRAISKGNLQRQSKRRTWKLLSELNFYCCRRSFRQQTYLFVYISCTVHYWTLILSSATRPSIGIWQDFERNTSINIYARLCALLRRCLSMAKTFFHVFNLWFEMVRDWENVAISTGMSRRLQLDLWRTKFLLYRYYWAPAYSWSLPSEPKYYQMFYHPS